MYKSRLTKYQKIGFMGLIVSLILFGIFIFVTLFFEKILFLIPVAFSALVAMILFCTEKWETNQASKRILDHFDASHWWR